MITFRYRFINISPNKMPILICIPRIGTYKAEEKCSKSTGTTSMLLFSHSGLCPIHVFQLYAKRPVSVIRRRLLQSKEMCNRLELFSIRETITNLIRINSLNGDFTGTPGPPGTFWTYRTSCRSHFS